MYLFPLPTISVAGLDMNYLLKVKWNVRINALVSCLELECSPDCFLGSCLSFSALVFPFRFLLIVLPVPCIRSLPGKCLLCTLVPQCSCVHCAVCCVRCVTLSHAVVLVFVSSPACVRWSWSFLLFSDFGLLPHIGLASGSWTSSSLSLTAVSLLTQTNKSPAVSSSEGMGYF